jgi:hypothetical protein
MSEWLEHWHGESEKQDGYYVIKGQVAYTAWTRWTEQEGTKLHQAVCLQLKTYGLFISGIFHLIFLDLS